MSGLRLRPHGSRLRGQWERGQRVWHGLVQHPSNCNMGGVSDLWCWGWGSGKQARCKPLYIHGCTHRKPHSWCWALRVPDVPESAAKGRGDRRVARGEPGSCRTQMPRHTVQGQDDLLHEQGIGGSSEGLGKAVARAFHQLSEVTCAVLGVCDLVPHLRCRGNSSLSG